MSSTSPFFAEKISTRRRCLLEALKQVHDLGFLLDVLNFLDHVEVGCPRGPDVHLLPKHGAQLCISLNTVPRLNIFTSITIVVVVGGGGGGWGGGGYLTQ